jgi:phosphoglycolate phosphatase
MLLVFDWDGTLLDSTGKIIRSMQLAISELGLPPRHDEQVREIIGLGLMEALKTMYHEFNYGLDVLEPLRATYAKHYVELDVVPCGFYPGARETLETLRQRGHHLAVATGKSRKGLDRVLINLGMQDYLDATRCADETQSKPHPQMLHELLDELRYAPQQTRMIGDTEFDLMMANNAGISAIAVTHGAHDLPRLQACQPQAVIHAIPELLEFV